MQRQRGTAEWFVGLFPVGSHLNRAAMCYPRMRGLHCLFASCAKEAQSCWTGQTPASVPSYTPAGPRHPNPPESSLYISPPTLSAFLSDNEKHQKSAAHSGANPKLAVWFTGLWCGQQQLKSVTPGPHPSGFQHQPWPLTHTKLQPGNGSTQQGNASVSETHWNHIKLYVDTLSNSWNACSPNVSACKLTHTSAVVHVNMKL